MTEMVQALAAGLRPLLSDIRRAHADTASGIAANVTAERLERWAETIERVLENAGQGTRSRGTIALEELSSEND